MKIYELGLIVILVLAVNSQAQPEQPPFNVTTVISVPHLAPGDRNIGIELTVQNNNDAAIENLKT
ncbi:Uncharacterised protein [uncultured archaeon]|nr:Uncharacterised protein [uncultured archaeon]